MEASADYFRVAFNAEPQDGAARALYAQLPEGKAYDEKFLYGIWRVAEREPTRRGVLIGVLEGTRDYPEAGTWWIGLLLFHPTVRGIGLGRDVLATLIERARAGGASRLRVAVGVRNPDAQRFLEREGFRERERQRDFVEMERAL